MMTYDDITDGKSDYFSIAFIIKLRFREGSQSPILTLQPSLLPGRLKEGCYLRLKVGVMDRE